MQKNIFKFRMPNVEYGILKNSAIRNFCFTLTLCLCAYGSALAIEIQVGGNGNNNGAGNVVGYVDMEKIFHEYPETKKAMLDYQKEVSKKREDIARLESQLLELKQKKAVMENTFMESTSTTNVVSLSTEPDKSGNYETTLSELNSQIEQQNKSLVETKTGAERELIAMEERRSLSILGKIYKTMEKLAEAEGVSVVVDKSSVLYGVPGVDLTEKLQKRLRGE